MQTRDFVETLTLLASKSGRQSIREIQNVVISDDFIGQLKLVRELKRGMDIIKIVTPINYEEERNAFLNGCDSHPIFKYDTGLLDEISSTFEDEGEFLWRKYNVADGTIRGLLVSLLENRTRDICITAEFVSAMEAHSHQWQNRLIREKYGEIDEDLAIEAALLLDELRMPDEYPNSRQPIDPHIENELALMQFDSGGIKGWFDFALAEYGFETPIEISDEYKYIKVCQNYDGVTICIPSDISVNGIRLLELIRHEIECHVRSFMNTEALLRPYNLKYGIGGIDNDILDEGYAMLEEDKLHQYLFGTGKKPIPWYVLAIDLAQEGRGFVQVANQLRSYLKDCNYTNVDELAWRYAYRVFRGSQNTFHIRDEEEAFVFTKDKAYLEGYLLAKELEKAGLSHWLELGGLRPDELLEIANVVDFQPSDLPYPDKNITDKIYHSLLETLEQEG